MQRQVPVVPRYAALFVGNGGMAGFAGDDTLRAASVGCRQARR